MSQLIQLENVTKKYPDGHDETLILNHIHLNIEKGDFIGIIGPSGSGKTTLLNILGLVDHFQEGTYYYQAQAVNQQNEKAKAKLRGSHFGFVLQNFGLVSDLSVLENILLPTKYVKRTKEAQRATLEKLLQSLDIAELIKKSPNKLSGGQQQRVAIARALINDPALILADEPTGNLDHGNSRRVLDILKRENESGRTIIMVTHDHEMLRDCNRVIEIHDGNLVEVR